MPYKLIAEIAPTGDWSRLAVAIRTYFDPEYAKTLRVKARSDLPRGADAPLGTCPRPSRRCGSPPSQGSRRSPCFYSSPLDAARSKDGAGPRRLMLGTLAACLRFRRPRGRGRRSALLNVGPRLAARSPLPRVDGG